MGREDRAAFLSARKKEAIRIQRRRNLLWKKSYDQYVELEKPVRAGWQRFYVLRPDIAKSPQGPRIQRLLDNCLQSVVYSARKEFTHRDYKTKKWIPME